MDYISIAFSPGLTVGDPTQAAVETFRSQQRLDPRFIPEQSVSLPVNLKGSVTDITV